MNEQGPRGVEVRPSGRWGNHGTVVQPFGAWNWTDTLAGTSSVARWIEAPISLLLIIELQRKIHLKKKKEIKKWIFPSKFHFTLLAKLELRFNLNKWTGNFLENGQFESCYALRQNERNWRKVASPSFMKFQAWSRGINSVERELATSFYFVLTELRGQFVDL